MTADGAVYYYCAPTVAWVKDASRTIVVEEEEGQSWCLQGVEAVIWDLLTLHYPSSGIADFLAVLLGDTVEGAKKTLLAVLRDWEEAGIVCAGEGAQRG